MATIITKFSDHVIQPIEYFCDAIEAGFGYRDIKGLTNDKVDMIRVSKQHPLAVLMSAQLSDNRKAEDLRSSLIPAISVIPGNQTEEGFTIGQSMKPEIVNDDFIDELKAYLDKTNKQILSEVLITKTQIDDILSAYKRNSLFCQTNEWRKAEEVNVSLWSDTPDIDNLFSQIMDSVLSDMQVGFFGDNSVIKNMKFRVTRGLTNFNFGRVLFGSEYSLTYTNSYRNYIVYSEERITEHDFDGTFVVSGEEA
jgi:hypothetical protein